MRADLTTLSEQGFRCVAIHSSYSDLTTPVVVIPPLGALIVAILSSKRAKWGSIEELFQITDRA